jgi:hypothetical protein
MLSLRTLVGATVFMGIMEAASAFFIDVPAAAALFAALFFASAVWVTRRRNGVVVPILLALLFAVEVAGVPFYQRSSTSDWVLQILGGVVSFAGLVAAVRVVRGQWRSRRGSAAAITA